MKNDLGAGPPSLDAEGTRDFETFSRPQPPIASCSEKGGREAFPGRHPDRRAQKPCTVSIILPTYNEAENLPVLLSRLEKQLVDIDYEIIIVDDDSQDLTWQVAAELAEDNWRITSIRRLGERGLSSAVMSGMEVSRGQALLVMDADLQHDETVIGQLIDPLLNDDADIVIGSREIAGGSYGTFGRWRRVVSWTGKQLAARLLGTQVTDPMSGFFAISRSQFNQTSGSINPRGFKILLEFLARSDEPRVQEVGYGFRERIHGSTKMSRSVVGSYVLALLDLIVGRVVSSTFTAYALVGSVGALVRFSLLILLGPPSLVISACAFEASVITNYVLNNRFTFAAHTRTGRRFWSGLIPFHLIALYGLMAQVGIARAIDSELEFAELPLWSLAVGIGLATGGNFVGNRSFTWRQPRQ